MHKYRLIAKKGEGTFSEVLKAQCVKNGKMTAIKCMKSQFESEEQVNNLREIQALRRLSPHPGIIKLVEVLYEQPTGRLALVFELMDMNIYELIRGRRQYLPEARIKSYMYQLIKAMDHMHRNGIFHRDIKPENILIADDVLKLADFGSCRGIYSKQPYTEYISTRWYRAPECLLTDGYYNYKMDLWGIGCVFFEIVSLYPLFPGTNELDQIHKIHNILGTPPPEVLEKFKRHATHMELNFPVKEGSGMAKLITHASEDCIELLHKLLAYNPEDRVSARQAMRHPYLKELKEMEKKAKRELISTKEGHGGGDERGNRKSARDDESGRGLPTISKGGGHDDSYAPSLAPSQTSVGHGGTYGSHGSTMTQASSLGGTQGQTQRQTMGFPELSSSVVRGMPKIGGGGGGGGAGVGAVTDQQLYKKAGQSSKLKGQYPKRSGQKQLSQPRITEQQPSKYGPGPDQKLIGAVGAHMQMQVQGNYGSPTTNRSSKYPLGLGGASIQGVPKYGGSSSATASAAVAARDLKDSGGKNYQSPYSQKYLHQTRD